MACRRAADPLTRDLLASAGGWEGTGSLRSVSKQHARAQTTGFEPMRVARRAPLRRRTARCAVERPIRGTRKPRRRVGSHTPRTQTPRRNEMRGSWMKRTATVAMVLAVGDDGRWQRASRTTAWRPGHGRSARPHRTRRRATRAHGRNETGGLRGYRRRAQRAPGARRPDPAGASSRCGPSLDAPSPSLDAVLAQADSIGALETQAKKIELTAVVKIRGLLTDEQWQELRPGAGDPAGTRGRCPTGGSRAGPRPCTVGCSELGRAPPGPTPLCEPLSEPRGSEASEE